MKEAIKFWLIWNEKDRVPRKKHFSENDARIEAERLAVEHAPATFVVLESIGEVVVKNVEWFESTDISNHPVADQSPCEYEFSWEQTK